MVSGTTTNSAQVQLALDTLSGMEALDVDKTFTYFSDDFEHHMLPKSYDGKVRSKEELYAILKHVFTTLKYIKVK